MLKAAASWILLMPRLFSLTNQIGLKADPAAAANAALAEEAG